MKDSNEEHYTINMQTHYTVQYRSGSSVWMSGIPKIKYYLTIEEARTAIEKAFKDGLKEGGDIDEATIIEWKKTPVLVKKNIKPPVIQSKTTFDIEVFNRLTKEWYVRRHEFEKLSDAEAYVQSRHFRDDWDDQFRIVQRDTTVKTSVV